ncbi:ABC transporter ATP-binding protein [Derxia gummosa]|uniref:ABC transporter ATP-binding protein n=1 Tax=Derxia gummosa DSM 723 TaxID=1121388 RepID=A0A9U5C5S9_9BURK|nr:ABC transporter ATP-binding protein [Derxia gummosa]
MFSLRHLSTRIASEHGTVTPVDDVSLDLHPGETFALVGESGSGKSVTALTIARLLPDNAWISNGQVLDGDTDLVDLPEHLMRAVRGRRIAFIFQEPATSLNPVMTIGRQICEAIETHTELRGAASKAKAIDWLRRVGIPEPERRFDSYPFQMSGGQKQRVMIAMALALEPELLIADEPTTALDVTVQKQILDLLMDLRREHRMAILLITHDLGVVAQVADRVALMYAGQIVETATARDFFARPLHPYASQLLDALPDTGKRGHALEAIAGSVPALNREFTGCRFAPRCRFAAERCEGEVPALFDPAPLLADTTAAATTDASAAARHGSAGTGRIPATDRAVRCFGFDPAHPLPLVRRQAPSPESGIGNAASGPASATVAASLPAAAGAAAIQAKPASSAPLLAVNDLWVRFPTRGGLLRRITGSFDAVRGVSFELRAGETLALVGESGCGKTTTGKALLQLLRGVALTSGSARLDGIDLMTADGPALRRARRDAQIIFQDPFASLNPRMRVGEILEEGLLSLRPEFDAAERTRRIDRLLDQVGLARGARVRYPHEFSGGQRQRIAIARALAVEPRLIVCDEPTSALDVSVQAQILNLLRQLQADLGVAYLFITHNIAVVEYLAERVAVMRAGEIVEQGSVRRVLEAPESDYTRTLIDAVPQVPARPAA